VLVLDGHVGRDAVVERIEQRIHLIPRYRMRLEEVLGGAGYPVWEQDRQFDAERHVRRMAVPAPGGDAELCELVGQLMSERLDRSRPLWQVIVAEGLAGGRTALIAKMHHSLVDGIAAVDVSTVILDPTPEGLELPPPDDAGTEERRAARVEQLTRRAVAQFQLPRRLAQEAVVRALRLDPWDAARQARSALGVLSELARTRPQAPKTRINVGIGRDRLFATARGRLNAVKEVGRAANATVNDVLLTAVALMLSRYLEPDDPDAVVALVPVSIREEHEQGDLGNRISTVFVDLPLQGAPLERLAAVSAEMGEIKRSAAVQAGALVVGATGLAPPLVSSLAVRAMGSPRLFNLVVSNVPGPQQTFYLAGVPLREVFPAVPLNPHRQALAVGILSYDGGVYFGLLADRDALPDIADAAAGIEAALEELASAI
jgi:WS/DGAT/MGAT family acyltransferase